MQFKLRSLLIAVAFVCPALIVLAPILRSPEFRDLWLSIRDLTLSVGWGYEGEQDAVAGIMRMGGIVQRDETRSDQPVVSVRLRQGWMVTNPGLVHLKSFKRLESLEVCGADVYDSGLAQVRGLKALQTLTFSNTWITSVGLGHLKQLHGLVTLDLSLNPGITDSGLGHLKGLTNLKELDLSDTSVTEAGINDLQRSLPTAKIVRQP